MCALPGSANALKHGGRSRRTERYGLVLATLGPRRRSIDMKIQQYRVGLERLCRARHGEVNVVHASYINAAATCEGMRCMAVKLQQEHPDIATMRAIVQFSEQRNRNVARLKLGGAKVDDDADEAWDFAADDAGEPSADCQDSSTDETCHDDDDGDPKNARENGLS